MSFDKIYYQGLEQLADIVDDTVQTSTYKHIYRTNFDRTSKQHTCFQFGAWCWKQALRQPYQAIKFLVNKSSK